MKNLLGYIKSLFDRYDAWCLRRYWKARHLGFMNSMIHANDRWLASDPLAMEFVNRYKLMMSEEWYKHSHESINVFRTRLGLDPVYKKQMLISEMDVDSPDKSVKN